MGGQQDHRGLRGCKGWGLHCAAQEWIGVAVDAVGC